MSKTITVSLDEETEREFREKAGIRYGRRKGYLGEAISDAMKVWMKKAEGDDADMRALRLLKKGFYLGKILYKSRDELHER